SGASWGYSSWSCVAAGVRTSQDTAHHAHRPPGLRRGPHRHELTLTRRRFHLRLAAGPDRRDGRASGGRVDGAPRDRRRRRSARALGALREPAPAGLRRRRTRPGRRADRAARNARAADRRAGALRVSTAPARVQRSRNATEDSILDAARDALIDEPYERLTIETIARRAYVSRTAVYFYFPNKRAVVDRLIQHAFSQIYHAAEPYLEGEGEPRRDLHVALARA